MGAPLVSVIMPVRDRAGCVGRAIDGVLAQTYPNVELIVVDDGSTDATPDILRGYGAAITVLREEGVGAYVARNRGLAAARGALIAFADSDDLSLPQRLARQVPLLERPEVGLVFGDALIVPEPTAQARPTGRRMFQVSPPRRGRVAEALVWRNFVPTTTVLVRRACLDEIGGFETSSRLSADYLAWFRIAQRHELDFVAEPVCLYTLHAEGISFALGRSLQARIALFSAELERTRDVAVRRQLRRLLFNLSMHMALAGVRGRADGVISPMALAARTAWSSAGVGAGLWAAAFAADQAALRVRRALQ